MSAAQVPSPAPVLGDMERPPGPEALDLQREAERHGFIVSWARAEIPEAWRRSYEQWIAEHRNAGVGQLSRGLESRLEPQSRFGWARSVMLLAAPHAYFDPGFEEGGLRIGRVARRFWVREPEPFFLKRLIEPNIDAIKRYAADLGVRCRDYVDQGPLPNNLFAVGTGRFWRGRNAMALNPEFGTRVTLAGLLTELDFDVELPEHPDRCGSCNRCVDRCPTGALLGDRRIDLNLCVSYWTTTHLDVIPGEMWDGIGDWVLGCDICQDVCPWNHRTERGGWAWEGYRPEPELAHPRLDDLITEPAARFSERYADSAFERIGRARVVRNALIVLSNSHHSRAPGLITAAASDEVALVRATAARALARIGDRQGAERLAGDPDPAVRAEARAALDEH